DVVPSRLNQPARGAALPVAAEHPRDDRPFRVALRRAAFQLGELAGDARVAPGDHRDEKEERGAHERGDRGDQTEENHTAKLIILVTVKAPSASRTTTPPSARCPISVPSITSRMCGCMYMTMPPTKNGIAQMTNALARDSDVSTLILRSMRRRLLMVSARLSRIFARLPPVCDWILIARTIISTSSIGMRSRSFSSAS